MAFQLTQYQSQDLSGYLLAENSGIVIQGGITYTGDEEALALLENDITLGAKKVTTSLRISRGVVLSTGSLVDLPSQNTESGYGESLERAGDADLLAAAQAGLGNNATETQDAAVIEFDFTVTDPTKRYISVEVVFASDEYPEFASSFVDIGAILIDGVNYALFKGDAQRPLSVLQSNIDEGYFLDNVSEVEAGRPAAYAIEFDGLSYRLRISAELAAVGTGANNSHHIKIGIADTNDDIYDSAMFVSNIKATDVFSNIMAEYDPSALTNKKLLSFVTSPTKSESFFANTDWTEAQLAALAKSLGLSVADLNALKNLLNQANVFDASEGKKKVTIALFDGNDIIELGSGADVAYGGAGNDVIRGNAGADKLFGQDGNDSIYGGDGKDQLNGGAGSDTFYFDTAPLVTSTDKILDFQTGVDKIGLSSAVFTPLSTPGPLAAANFVAGSAAQDADDHIILNGTKLLYDADGNGAGKAVTLAMLTGTLQLSDIFVY